MKNKNMFFLNKKNVKILNKNIKIIIFIFLFVFMLLSLFNYNKKNIALAQNKTSSNNLKLYLEYEPIKSYTPAWYEGKVLASQESEIKIMSILENTNKEKVYENNLYYKWKFNNSTVYKQSGFGKTILKATLDGMLSQNDIVLEIYSDDSFLNLLTSKKIIIKPKKTSLNIYEKKNLDLLTYNQSLNKQFSFINIEKGKSLELIAEPFFFTVNNSLERDILFSWKLDNILINKENINFFSILRQNSGLGKIELEIENNTKVLQSEKTSLNFIVK